MKNREIAKYLLEDYSAGRLTKPQKLQLELIIADSLTYEGGAGEMSAFDSILEMTVDESNWKPVYIWKIKK